MKIIFLDIDGVINSAEYDLSRGEKDGNIDITRLPLIKRIVENTGAKIVLSSSWRKLWESDKALCSAEGLEIDNIFSSVGLKIFDKTPVMGLRSQEIAFWLENHPETESFVILDDMLFGWGELSDHLVRTDGTVGRGLENRHVEKAIEILNSK